MAYAGGSSARTKAIAIATSVVAVATRAGSVVKGRSACKSRVATSALASSSSAAAGRRGDAQLGRLDGPVADGMGRTVRTYERITRTTTATLAGFTSQPPEPNPVLNAAPRARSTERDQNQPGCPSATEEGGEKPEDGPEHGAQLSRGQQRDCNGEQPERQGRVEEEILAAVASSRNDPCRDEGREEGRGEDRRCDPPGPCPASADARSAPANPMAGPASVWKTSERTHRPSGASRPGKHQGQRHAGERDRVGQERWRGSEHRAKDDQIEDHGGKPAKPSPSRAVPEPEGRRRQEEEHRGELWTARSRSEQNQGREQTGQDADPGQPAESIPPGHHQEQGGEGDERQRRDRGWTSRPAAPSPPGPAG